MCRIEERIYIDAGGHRKTFEETFTCDKSRHGALCSNVKRRKYQYNYPKNASTSRDDSLSPLDPPTPTSSGTYLVRERRPSGNDARPPTRDGKKSVQPQIIIELGGSKKSKSPKYNTVSVSTPGYKRSSLGASSIGSNDIAVESPGSDASQTIRTGFPETTLRPSATLGPSDGYVANPPPAQARHHRHTSSASSSRTPSLYVTSDPDYESPTNHRSTRYQTPVVHNPTTTSSSSSPSRPQFRTAVVTPHTFSDATHTPDGLYPLDYAEYADRSGSSRTSSGAPESSRRGKDRDDRRKKQQEEEKEPKQVRFDDRAEAREKQRTQTRVIEVEKGRGDAREEMRRQNAKEQREKDERQRKLQDDEAKEARRKAKAREDDVARDRKKEKSKPPTRDFTQRPAGVRRNSMTQAERDEQRRLLMSEGLTMQNERHATEAREREEQFQTIAAAPAPVVTPRGPTEPPGYWDPRGGDRTLSNTTSGLTRRNSQSKRRNSIVNPSTAATLGRSNSNRRPNVVQTNPPETYATRPPSARTNNGPPVSFNNFNQEYSRPPSARRNSYVHQENPFAAPPTRGSGSSLENPFAAAPTLMSPTSMPDPWDVRVVQDALPVQSPVEKRYNSLQERGEAVINRSMPHRAAQQASRAMGRAAGYEDEYETSSEEETAPAYLPRSSLKSKGKKKY